MNHTESLLKKHGRSSSLLVARKSGAASKQRSCVPRYTSQIVLQRSHKEWENATRSWSRIVETNRESYGDDDDKTLRSIDILAHTYVQRHMFKDAALLQQEVLERRQKIRHDQEHLDIAESKYSLAYTYAKQFRLQLAKDLATQAWSQWNRALGSSHPRTSKATRLLSVIQYKSKQLERLGENWMTKHETPYLPSKAVQTSVTIQIPRTEVDDEIERVMAYGLAHIASSTGPKSLDSARRSVLSSLGHEKKIDSNYTAD